MSSAGQTKFLTEFPAALHEGNAAIFVGAGVSMAAGYPSWSALLRDIGEELGVNSRDVHDLAALAQWHILESGAATGIRNVIKKEIGKNLPVPEVLRIISRLPTRHIWTTNYDRLVERAFSEINRPIDPVSGSDDLSLKVPPGATRLYKMHGSVDRLDDIVISTDDYELYRSKRGAYLPLLQAQLSSMSMLFVGLSLTDPNVRHVLSLIRESFTDAPPEHFAIVRPPKREDYDTDEEYKARSAQHRLWSKDLRRYGLLAVEIDDYDEVPELLKRVERGVAAKRIWISGSWPINSKNVSVDQIYSSAEKLGKLVADHGLDLVSGSGMLVGPASISGFIEALREGGGWDIDRRLIVRPFPQPTKGKATTKAHWTALRTELARHAGMMLVIGGLKDDQGSEVVANGVMEEYELGKAAGTFILPIGAFGGAAKIIANELHGSGIAHSGTNAARPTDKELGNLSKADLSIGEMISTVKNILGRFMKRI